MKTALLMDFAVNKANNTITVKREFAAELSVVWDAFTKSEILDQWWAPRPWKSRTKIMDFREGGHWLYAMVGPEGEEHWSFINYETIEIKKHFAGIDGFSDAEGNVNTELPQSKWRNSFQSQGDETLVTIDITYSDLAQLEAIIEMGFKEGLTMAMEGLDELLAARA
jgi:uncharacterized protein YndB with AHSA1/START domain